MARIEQKFIYDGDSYVLVYCNKNTKVFQSENKMHLLVTDNDGEVLIYAFGDCAQNSGFISITTAAEIKQNS